jgi:hypothetical protein
MRKNLEEIGLLRLLRPVRLQRLMRSMRLQRFQKASKITTEDLRVIQSLEFSLF